MHRDHLVVRAAQPSWLHIPISFSCLTFLKGEFEGVFLDPVGLPSRDAVGPLHVDELATAFASFQLHV